jgi:hypothetical protein
MMNEQLLLDQVEYRIISTVKLNPEQARKFDAQYETVILCRKPKEFVESGPFYHQTEEDARKIHEMLKQHELTHLAILGDYY